MKTTLLVLFTLCIGFVQAQNKPAYIIFDKEGKQVPYTKMVNTLAKADVVCFGELHNDPISHWLELQVTKSFHKKKKSNLILGAEMFEADDQLVLDEYLKGQIKEGNFEEECKLWNNYKTDYKPLINYAKENEIHFVATNIPRRYASAVYKGGFEALEELTEQAKGFIAPLPITYDASVPCYQEMLEMAGGHGGENLPKAQAVKDATMAYFIVENLKAQKGSTFLHYNGAYHSDDYEGILWYVNKFNPELNSMTITTVQQESIKGLDEENMGKADFTICIPSDMITTY